MKSKKEKEIKIQNSFNDFFVLTKSKRRPTDFKSYNKSIYNVLCTLYKNEDNKINRDHILQKFVPEDRAKDFKHTNIYNKLWIIKVFKDFFESQKIKWKLTRSVWELSSRKESLTITISREYWYNGDWFVNREAFVDEYKLNTLGCRFIREAPIHTKINVEAITQGIKDIVENNGYRSPAIKPQYLKRLWQRYIDQNWKIDRLYILYKLIDNIEIAEKFRHRYAKHRWLDAPRTRTNRKDISEYNLPYIWLNPEELLIEKEEQKEYLDNKDKLYNMISNLSGPEQEVIQRFLAGEDYDQGMFFNIITKLKNNFNL